MSGSSNMLMLSAVDMESKGEYSCQAISDVGKVMSNSATVTVLGKDDLVYFFKIAFRFCLYYTALVNSTAR